MNVRLIVRRRDALPLPDAGGGARPADRRLWSMKKKPSTPPLEAVLGTRSRRRRGTARRRRAGRRSCPSRRRCCARRRAATCSASRRTWGWAGARRSCRGRSTSSSARWAGCAPRTARAVALGYHTGHWEIGLLVREAAETLRARAARSRSRRTCSDPCDGRTQGTTGMFDSLAYRNDAAIVMRRLIRSLPDRVGGDGHRDVRQGAAGDDARARGRARAAGRSSCRAA